MMMPKDLWEAMTPDQRWEAAHAAFTHDDMEFAKSLYLAMMPELPSRPVYEFARIMGRLGIAFCRTGEPEAGIRFFRQGAQVLAAGILTSEVFSEKEITDGSPTEPPGGAPANPLPETSTGNFTQLQAQLLYNIGLTQRYLGRHDEAVETFFQAHRLDVENGEILTQLGQIYYDVGYISHARACFQALTQVQPGNPAGWLTLGYIAAQSGDHDEARNCFETAVRLDPLLWNDCFEVARSLSPHFQRTITVLRAFLDETRPDVISSRDLDILTTAIETYELPFVPSLEQPLDPVKVPPETPSEEADAPSIFSFDDFRAGEETRQRAA